MARREKQLRPISEEELEQMPELISEHFDRVRALLKEDIEASEDD
ncbi:MAG: hypothetical protein ABEI76_05805 [Halobacteriales archaeon]